MTRTRVRYGASAGGVIGNRETGDSIKPTVTYSSSITDSLHKGPPYRTGGPMGLTRQTVVRPDAVFPGVKKTSIPQVWYFGSFYATHYTPPGGTPLWTDLSPWGTRGWNRAMPIRDVASIALFVGELKDAPRMIRGVKDFLETFAKRTYRNRSPSFWANVYLNYQFGIAPILRDIESFLTLGERVDQALSRLIARNNKPIRRRFEMDNVDSTTFVAETLGSVPMAPVLSSQCYDGSVTVDGDKRKVSRIEMRYRRRIWFSSRWRYYFTPEELNNPHFLNHLKADLAGLNLDLNAIYNLIPWTWLLDWFTNTGTIVSNLVQTNKYRQVAEYAYVMCTESVQYTKNTSCPVRIGTHQQMSGAPFVTVNCFSSNTYERKRRVTATPYGFGLTWDGFTPYQLSILLALGLSRT